MPFVVIGESRGWIIEQVKVFHGPALIQGDNRRVVITRNPVGKFGLGD